MTNRKFKKTAGCLMAVAMMAMMAMPALAGQWQKNAAGWWWQEDNGTYPMNTWCWLDGNRDGIAECYYFNGYGYMLAGTVTPDGYTVNENGAWTVNGVVQTKIVPATTSGGVSMPTVGGSSGGTTTTTQAATTVANGNEIREYYGAFCSSRPELEQHHSGQKAAALEACDILAISSRLLAPSITARP